MSELLDALVAAHEAGLDAPRCHHCDGERGFKSSNYHGGVRPCHVCHATGLDASDPEKLIGRAHVWLLSQKHHPRLTLHPLTANYNLFPSDNRQVCIHEDGAHNAAGLATALLRLVARVGGAA